MSLSPANINGDHEREHKSPRCLRFRKPPAVFPFLQRIKEEWLKLETCAHSTFWKSAKGARVSFKIEMKIKALLIQPPWLCAWGYSRDFSFFLFFPFLLPPPSTPTLPPPHPPCKLSHSIWDNLNYGSIPPNLENSRVCAQGPYLFETDKQGVGTKGRLP